MKIKIGVTGKENGNVTSALLRRGAIHLDCDITDDDAIEDVLERERPDIIINAASKTSVDWCDKKENNKELFSVNIKGAYSLASKASFMKIPVVALSTDHVFDGKRGPYKEKYLKTLPVNQYGISKFAMEGFRLAFDNFKVIRTSNLFWKDDERVTWYFEEAYRNEKVPVPIFQKRSFMHIEHFVDALLVYIENYKSMPKLLNISGRETVNYYAFVKAFAEAIDFPFVYKFKKNWFETGKFPAKRPKKAGLNTELSARLGIPQYSYVDGLKIL